MAIAAIECEQPVDLLEALRRFAGGDHHDIAHQQRRADGEQAGEIGAPIASVDHGVPLDHAGRGVEAPDARRRAAATGEGVALINDERTFVGDNRGEIGHRAAFALDADAADLAGPELVARIKINGAHPMTLADENAVAQHGGNRGHDRGFSAGAVEVALLTRGGISAEQTVIQALVELKRPDLPPGFIGISAIGRGCERRATRAAASCACGALGGCARACDRLCIHADSHASTHAAIHAASKRNKSGNRSIGARAIAHAPTRHGLQGRVGHRLAAQQIGVLRNFIEQRDGLERPIGAQRVLREHQACGKTGGRESAAGGGGGGPVLAEHALGGARLHVAKSSEHDGICQQEAFGLRGD